MSFNELYELMLEHGVVSEETLRVVTDINGNTVEALNDILFVVTGYRNWEQYKEELSW